MNKIKKVMEECGEEFNSAFMNNGVNGLLDDNFQDPRMLIIKKHFKQSQKQLVEAIEKELVSSIKKLTFEILDRLMNKHCSQKDIEEYFLANTIFNPDNK